MFLLGVGMMITNITGSFNLCSSAGSKFSPYFLDPIAFLAILYCDYNMLASREILGMAYCSLIVGRSILYIQFMEGVVNQICEHMDIPFIHVKQGYKQVDYYQKTK